MKYVLTRTTQPSTEPVTLAEAKTQCLIEQSETFHDTYLTELIVTARKWLEDETERSFGSSTWTLYLNGFPSGTKRISLPRPPLISLGTINYTDTDGNPQTYTTAQASLGDSSFIIPEYNECWPDARVMLNAVDITFTAGYATNPQQCEQAIKLLVAHWFRDRESGEIPAGVQRLADQLNAGDQFNDYGLDVAGLETA